MNTTTAQADLRKGLLKAGLLLVGMAVAASLVARISGPAEPETFGRVEAEVYCESVIKAQLRDPDSYRVLDTTIAKPGVAVISFTAKNGFGGVNRTAAVCQGTWNGEGFTTTASLVQ